MCGRWIQIWIYQYSGQAAPSRVCLITHSSLGEWSHLLTNDQLRKARGQRDRRPSSFGWGRDERRKKRREKKNRSLLIEPVLWHQCPLCGGGGWRAILLGMSHTRARYWHSMYRIWHLPTGMLGKSCVSQIKTVHQTARGWWMDNCLDAGIFQGVNFLFNLNI